MADRIKFTEDMRNSDPQGVARLEQLYAEQDAATAQAAAAAPVSTQQPAPVEATPQAPAPEAVPQPAPAAPVNEPTPPAVTPPETPAAPVVLTKADLDAAVQRERDYINGRLGRELQKRDETIARLENELRAPPPAPAAVQQQAFIPDDELLKIYGQDAVDTRGYDFLRNKEEIKRELRGEQRQVLTSMKWQNDREKMFADVAAIEPRFAAVDAIKDSAAVQEFLDSPVTGMGRLTYGELYDQGERAMDAQRIARVYTDFLKANPSAVPSATSKPKRAVPPVAVQPNNVVAAQPELNQADPVKAAEDDYMNFLRDADRNPGKYTRAELQQREEANKQAIRARRAAA